MDENILKFRVGIFVVIAMCILGILIFLNSEGWVAQYTVFLNTYSAPGVTEGTPIRKNGILIGRVKRVEVMPPKTSNEKEVVSLRMAINDSVKIYENETCLIGSDSLLGDASIEFVNRSNDRGPQVVPGSEHTMARVEIAPNPIKLVGDMAPQLQQTLVAIQTASIGVNETADGIKTLTNNIQSTFQDEESELKTMIKNFSTMTVRAQAALDGVDQFFETANDFIDDPEMKLQLRAAFMKFFPIMKEIEVTIRDTRETINSFETIPEGFTENLDNLKVFTEALKNQGPDVVDQINTSLQNVDELVAEVKGFTSSLSKLQNSDGTLGKFINDPELYNRLLSAVKKIEREVIKIEPTINDIRLFTDAIARDPGILGVRGALNRKSDKAGYKGSAGRDGGFFK